MTNELRDRLEKIYALAIQGATEGERAAAKLALDRLMKRYNLSEDDVNNIDKKECVFVFRGMLELALLERIMAFFIGGHKGSQRSRTRVYSKLVYLDWVTVDCAYEYFRRHMRSQYDKVLKKRLKRIRKKRSKEKLMDLFFSRYIIASKLYKDGELQNVTGESSAAIRERLAMEQNVEGGTYNRQLVGGLMLETE
jgi:hypothetical protein